MAPNLSSDAPKVPSKWIHGEVDVEAAAVAAALKVPSKRIHGEVVYVEAAPAVVHGSPDGRVVDYLARAQWLRAAVLGANDGLISVTSLMIGVGAVNEGHREMLVSGLAGLVAGAFSMAIGEFVSVHAQYDIQVAHSKRRARGGGSSSDDGSSGSEFEGADDEESLPSPTKAAAASALAFALGAALPLLSGGFVRPWAIRVAAVCAASSLGLAGFGAAGAYLGGASVVRSGLRVLLGGWVAMAATYGILRLFALVLKTHVDDAA